MAKIQDQYLEQLTDTDESALYKSLLSELSVEDMALWQKEAEFDLEHRTEYYQLYQNPEERLEKDILALFEAE